MKSEKLLYPVRPLPPEDEAATYVDYDEQRDFDEFDIFPYDKGPKIRHSYEARPTESGAPNNGFKNTAGRSSEGLKRRGILYK